MDGTLYVDGDWIKKGWKKKFETLIGREITVKEWKNMRYKSVYVIADSVPKSSDERKIKNH